VTYLKDHESFGRIEKRIDLVRFAADLAKQLAGKTTTEAQYPDERQGVMVGTDLINLSADNHKKRVHVSISAPEVPWDDRNTYDKAHKTESASVNPDGRTIERIAADIKRRVIEPSKEPLRLQREHAVKMAEGRASIVRLSAALKARLPGLDVRTNEKEQRAAIYSGSNGHYLSATLSGDGTIAVERLGSMPMSKFERIVAILNEGNKGKTAR
jgi:hypothetical protein